MIIDQIGGPLEETFSEFNEVAVAAASLGQVSREDHFLKLPVGPCLHHESHSTPQTSLVYKTC
jgi:hypothetical protein